MRKILLVLIFFSALTFQSKAEDFTALASPTPAPHTEFSDALGQPVTFEAFKGNALLVNFWATWCPPCLKEMPSLNKMSKDFEKDGVKVIAISFDREGIKKVAPFYRNYGLNNLKIYMDEKNRFLRDMQIGSLPSTYLIDRSGNIVASLKGTRNWDDPTIRKEILMRLLTQQQSQQ